MILKNDHTSGDSFPLIPGRRKEDRVYCWCHNLWGIGKNGGKFYDINFKGAPYPPNPKYPLGKICLEPTYIFWQCDALAWCYGVGEVMPMQYVWMWTENKNGTKYWINEMSKQSRLTWDLRPSQEVLLRTRGTLLEFLKRAATELQVYRFVNEVSAVYFV